MEIRQDVSLLENRLWGRLRHWVAVKVFRRPLKRFTFSVMLKGEGAGARFMHMGTGDHWTPNGWVDDVYYFNAEDAVDSWCGLKVELTEHPSLRGRLFVFIGFGGENVLAHVDSPSLFENWIKD